jgi:serine/threonine protein kinase
MRINVRFAASCTAVSSVVFWMSPELVQVGGIGYSLKADIWSFGCVVLEMWTGRRPWQGEDGYTVILKVCSKGR